MLWIEFDPESLSLKLNRHRNRIKKLEILREINNLLFDLNLVESSVVVLEIEIERIDWLTAADQIFSF